ncbi:MAG: ABC transporter ATP-binding protein [Dehalococcoidales bacterium]|nr:ABC transporter ATP-binding protein [Dehalococcoidales bacterium]
MRKLLKHMKPFIWPIIAIFVLLFAQAMSDLSLPSYMARIVNVGIGQNGVETAVPEAISQTEYNKIALFMTGAEKAQVDADYRLLEKQSISPADYAIYVKTYPQLANYPIYLLNTKVKTELNQLDVIFGKTIPVVAAIEQNGLAAYGSTIQIPAGVDPFTVIAQLPPAQLEVIRTAAGEQTKTVSATLLKQYSTIYISAQYKALGRDIGGIQTGFMLKIGMFMLLLTVASAGCSIIVGYLSSKIASGMGRNIRLQLFKKVESFSNTEFDKFSTASLITMSTNDITQIQMLMVMLFRIVFYAPIMGVGGVIKVIGADSSMLWIIGAAVGALLTMMVVMFVVVVPKFETLQKFIDKLNLAMREILTGLMVIRAFNTQKHEEQKFDKVNSDLTKVSLFVNRVMVFLMPVMMLIMNGVVVLIVWIGAHQINAGAMQIGDMMAFMQYAMQIIFSFLMVSIVFVMLPRASVSAVRISEVLETEPIINDPAKPETYTANKKGLVEFKNVSFRYPGAEDDVLAHITFTARPGQTTAFIGSTGSGKTTLINLIPRFYDVTEGQVLIDGLDVRQVTQHDLREKIGYVSQKAVLFSGTVESNIKYANENASAADVAKFAETAQAAEFIKGNEKGYAMEVSQGGTNLSGGQKQRLAIARALAKQPEIYIFDDSLSALDYKTDVALRQALKKETADATVLIVTQRVSTIMNADKIVVLDNGKIAGIGTHADLIKESSVYREIALSQLSKEELAI